MEILLWTFVRLLVPFSILRWPLLGIALSAYVDGIDYGNLPLRTTEDYESYQVWDKLLDIYYLGFAAYTSFFWKDSIAKAVSLVSFLYRFIGVVLFVVLDSRIMLFVFPNFFENFFVFYLLFVAFAKKKILFTSLASGIAITLSILLPKLMQEYFMHILRTTPNHVLGLDKFFPDNGIFLMWIDWVIYMFIPVALLFVLLKTRRVKVEKM